MGTIDIILCFMFLVGFYIGYRRGFILQAIHLVGFIIAYIVAYQLFRDLAPILQAWVPYPLHDQEVGQSFWVQLVDMEGMFYSALAFALLFFGTKMALQIIGHLLTMVASLPGLNFANRWLGGFLGFIGAFVVIFILVHVIVFIPWETGQILVTESTLTSWMIEQGSFFTNQLQEQWNLRGEF